MPISPTTLLQKAMSFSDAEGVGVGVAAKGGLRSSSTGGGRRVEVAAFRSSTVVVVRDTHSTATTTTTTTPTFQKVHNVHTTDLIAVTLTHCGNTCASADTTGTVTVWGIDSGEVVCIFSDPTLCSLAFSACGAFLFAGTCKGRVHVYVIETAELCCTFVAAETAVMRLAASHCGETLATASCNEVTLWGLKDVFIASHIAQLPCRGVIGDIAITKCGSRLLARSGEVVTLWDAHTGRKLRKWKCHPKTDIGEVKATCQSGAPLSPTKCVCCSCEEV